MQWQTWCNIALKCGHETFLLDSALCRLYMPPTCCCLHVSTCVARANLLFFDAIDIHTHICIWKNIYLERERVQTCLQSQDTNIQTIYKRASIRAFNADYALACLFDYFGFDRCIRLHFRLRNKPRIKRLKRCWLNTNAVVYVYLPLGVLNLNCWVVEFGKVWHVLHFGVFLGFFELALRNGNALISLISCFKNDAAREKLKQSYETGYMFEHASLRMNIERNEQFCHSFVFAFWKSAFETQRKGRNADCLNARSGGLVEEA